QDVVRHRDARGENRFRSIDGQLGDEVVTLESHTEPLGPLDDITAHHAPRCGIDRVVLVDAGARRIDPREGTDGGDLKVAVGDGAAGDGGRVGPEGERRSAAKERETSDAGDDALRLVVHGRTFLVKWCARKGVSTSGRDVLQVLRSGHVPPITPSASHVRAVPGASVGMVTEVPGVTAGEPVHVMTGLVVAVTGPFASVLVSVASSVSTTSLSAIDPVLLTV